MKTGATFFLVLLMSLVISCSQGAPEKEIPTLRIGHAPHDHHAPLYIAALNPAYFKENGGIFLKEVLFRKEYELISNDRKLARVVIDSRTGGKKLVRRLDNNLADLSFGGVPAMLSFIDEGTPIRILSPVNAEGAGLVMATGTGINNWDEFIAYVRKSERPVKIGYKIAVSVQNLIFESALRAEGIAFTSPGSPADKHHKIKLINLYGPKNLIPAMENGIIDGFVIMQPFLALAESKGAGKTVAQLGELPPEGKWRGNPCCAIAGNEDYVKKHPEVVEAMLILLLRANTFIGLNPETSADLVARWLGTSVGVEVLSLPTISYTTEFDENWNRGVNFWVEQMLETGKLSGIVKDAHEKGLLADRIYDFSIFEQAKKKQ